mmetsp:Transcript_6982/g.19773  ORF Transcript_6982/g.19773 Transcript_6982/m.19773 type:complete len:435 (+) Transcript_6982:252-1556(+)
MSDLSLPSAPRRPLFPQGLHGLFALLFLEIYGAALTIPVFQYFCIVQLGLTATYVGIIMSSFHAAQLLGQPTVGRLSDACGRRVTLVCCFLWTSLCFFATAFVETFAQMLLVRTCAGLSGGSIPISQSMIMDVTASGERPRVLGALGGLLGVAFTLGPATTVLSLMLVEYSRRWVFLAAATFALVGCIVGACMLQETLPESKRRPLTQVPEHERHAVDSPSMLQEFRAIAHLPMACIWVGRFCSAFAFSCLFTTYAFLIRDAFHWGDKEFGMLLAASGIAAALSQSVIYPAASARLGKHGVFVAGSVLLAVYFLLLPWVTLHRREVVSHIAIKVFFCLGAAFTDAGIPDLVGFYAAEDQMGFAQGLTTACRSLSAVVAPLVAGRLYDATPYSVYLLAACLASVGGAAIACAPLMPVAKAHEDVEPGERTKLWQS